MQLSHLDIMIWLPCIFSEAPICIGSLSFFSVNHEIFVNLKNDFFETNASDPHKRGNYGRKTSSSSECEEIQGDYVYTVTLQSTVLFDAGNSYCQMNVHFHHKMSCS